MDKPKPHRRLHKKTMAFLNITTIPPRFPSESCIFWKFMGKFDAYSRFLLPMGKDFLYSPPVDMIK